MVFEALELLRSELEAYLKPFADPITVRLGNIATVAGTQANAVLITLVNLEEESTLKNIDPSVLRNVEELLEKDKNLRSGL